MPPTSDSEFGALPAHRKKVSFDPTINLGHILTFIGFIGAGFGAYSTLDKRVAMVEQVQAQQQAQVKDSISDLKGEVRETRRTVEEIARTQLQRVGTGR